MAWAGMAVGAVCRCSRSLGPARSRSTPASVDVELAGRSMSWLVPVLACPSSPRRSSLHRRDRGRHAGLGARLASFVGLTEVLFAVLFAWLLLDQLPERIQLAGGVLIVAGIAVRIDELRIDEAAARDAHGRGGGRCWS